MLEMFPGNVPDIAGEQMYPTPFQNSSLLPLLLLSLASQKHTPDTKSYFMDEYDYIVVGAGSAGSVVASRLSEIESVTVLLLEAGTPPPLLTEVPVIAPSFAGTKIDWNFLTAPQKYTAQLHKNKQIPYVSGKAIGGSSSINYMVYTRGHPQNFDDWEALGAKGWNSSEAFRNFIKAEDNRDLKFLKNGYHGIGGPMTVEKFEKESPIAKSIINAYRRSGYPYVDPNVPNQIGVSDYQENWRNRQRCSAAKAYLVPAENRTNLDIVAEAFVTKILIKHKKACGVRFDYKGHTYKVRARKEVILSAGSLNSPKLLQLSGIGPERILRKFGIPLVANLAVGENLQNHAGPVALFSASNQIPPLDKRMQNPNNILKYVNARKGILASSTYTLSLLKGNRLTPPVFVPDLQIFYSEVILPDLKRALNLKQQVYDRIYAPYENGTNVICVVNLMSPRSRGYVSLKSLDPYEQPVIQPNYLEDPEDVRLSVSGLKECYRILESAEMQKLGIRRFQTVIPGCEHVYGDEDLYLECSARAVFSAIYHAVGTAKMGDPADPTTVVDPKLRVKGVLGLRVVDASIMPTITTANINAAVNMIAEKASEFIKSDIWRRRKAEPLFR